MRSSFGLLAANGEGAAAVAQRNGRTTMFREQVNKLAIWFEQWNECEQTVALYSLLKRLAPHQARFCSLVLDQCLQDNHELLQQEQRANNPAYVSSLLGENTSNGGGAGREGALPVAPLLNHLLLLRPGNHEAKACYLSQIPRVLGASISSNTNIEAARQLLSYSLIHPAIGTDDRKLLTQWLSHLEERIKNQPSVPVPANAPVAHHEHTWDGYGGGPNSNGHANNGTECQPRVRRSNSLTPPVCIPQADLTSSQDDLCTRPKPRSFSLSSEHAPLSPQSSLASSGSGSESHLDELRAASQASTVMEHPGMKDVPMWLKTLRLHKYAWLFSSLTYDEMLSLSEEALEARGVTKGARHKIVLSVKKLKDRPSTLLQLEQEVEKGSGLRTALDELKNILNTPIKPLDANPTERDDLPILYTRVLGKMASQLLTGKKQPEEDVLAAFQSVLDRCVAHDAFDSSCRSRISAWRQQLMQLLPHERHVPQRKYSHPFSDGVGRGRPLQAPASRFGGNTARHASPPVLASSFPAGGTDSLISMHRYSDNSFFAKRPSLQDPLTEPLQTLFMQQRNKNAQTKATTSPQLCGLAASTYSKLHPTETETTADINTRLESLCLSVTEHALGGPGMGEI
ncbi:protein Smaug homolog 1 isoform X2 [Cloeon dipterum]|uniref:protein Smaug homolog 1 isoform X2 n=1 Tax=Cloeon dipterum TaxID=197152 RepID=UPI0032207F7F